MPIMLIQPANIGGYSREDLGHTVLGKWAVHRAAGEEEAIGRRETDVGTCCRNTVPSAQIQ